MSAEFYAPLLLLALIIFVAYQLSRGFRKGWAKGAVEAPSTSDTPRIYLARYLTGFPDQNQYQEPVYCAVTDADYIFRYGSRGSQAPELARLPRHALISALTDNKTIIAQRLTTVTRLAFFGPFALAMPKKKKVDAYWLDLEWSDPLTGVSRHSVFEFTGPQCDVYARRAANEILKYVQAPPDGPGPDEKLCPMCAETVKRQAKICRFCGHTF